MARACWPLRNDRPSVQVVLSLATGGLEVARHLLADTGAGKSQGGFELILEESDCLMCGGKPAGMIRLHGSYAGSFPVYLLRIQVPQLAFDQPLPIVGVPHCPPRFDGIAGFRFLNRFTYGNFGDPNQFGLEI